MPLGAWGFKSPLRHQERAGWRTDRTVGARLERKSFHDRAMRLHSERWGSPTRRSAFRWMAAGSVRPPGAPRRMVCDAVRCLSRDTEAWGEGRHDVGAVAFRVASGPDAAPPAHKRVPGPLVPMLVAALFCPRPGMVARTRSTSPGKSCIGDAHPVRHEDRRRAGPPHSGARSDRAKWTRGRRRQLSGLVSPKRFQPTRHRPGRRRCGSTCSRSGRAAPLVRRQTRTGSGATRRPRQGVGAGSDRTGEHPARRA